MGISIGMVGLGQFGRQFAELFRVHPLVDRIALCDMDVARVRKFADQERWKKKLRPSDCYGSLDEILKSDLDALVVITQQWLHAAQCLRTLEAGKSVYSAVPIVQLPDTDEILDYCDKLVAAVKKTGKHYMLGETTVYGHEAAFCRRQAAKGAFGAFVYSEGEYCHSFDFPGCDLRGVMKGRFSAPGGEQWARKLEDYRKRGLGMGPMLYPTHSVSGPMSAMNAHPLKVSCFGQKPITKDPYFQQQCDTFSNETAIFQMSNGSTMRICEHRETSDAGEMFRLYGTDAYFSQTGYWNDYRDGKRSRNFTTEEMADPLPREVMQAFLSIHEKPAAPGTPGAVGKAPANADRSHDFVGIFTAHGGSHPYMVHEFVDAIAHNRVPRTNVWEAARYMAAGVMAHKSALRDGECLTVPDWGDAP